jgi:hypothetical protein
MYIYYYRGISGGVNAIVTLLHPAFARVPPAKWSKGAHTSRLHSRRVHRAARHYGARSHY